MESAARLALSGASVWGAPLELPQRPPDRLAATFSVQYSFDVRFTWDAFDPDNDLIATVADGPGPARLLVVLDADVVARRPELPERVEQVAADLARGA